eukprot:scaffold101899_cov15-Tisochrysis_lutea.AAC.1
MAAKMSVVRAIRHTHKCACSTMLYTWCPDRPKGLQHQEPGTLQRGKDHCKQSLRVRDSCWESGQRGGYPHPDKSLYFLVGFPSAAAAVTFIEDAGRPQFSKLVNRSVMQGRLNKLPVHLQGDVAKAASRKEALSKLTASEVLEDARQQ